EVTGRAGEGVALVERALQGRSPDNRGYLTLARAYARAGKRDEAKRILDQFTHLSHPSTYSIAMIYLALGDNDRFIEWLTKAFGGELVIFVKSDPLFDSVRSDPRFRALVDRLRIPDNR